MNYFFIKITAIALFSFIPFQIKAMQHYNQEATDRLKHLIERLVISNNIEQSEQSGNGFNRLQQLILLGANPNTLSCQDVMVIEPAIRFERLEVARFLLAHGFDPNLRAKKGNTPLILSHEKPAIMRILLDSGAIVNNANNNNETALWWASKNNEPESVRLLLEKGADPDLQDKYRRYSALMWAAQLGRENIFKMLIAARARVDLKNQFGKNAFEIAATYKNSELAKLDPDQKRNLSQAQN